MSEKKPRGLRGPRVRVQVSAEHIAQAMVKDSGHCMIAEAIKDALPKEQIDTKRVLVDLATLRWSNPKKRERYIYLTPGAAQTALLRFDQGEPVAPFTFTLMNAHTMRMLGSSSRRPRQTQGPTELVVSGNTRPIRRGGHPAPLGVLSNAKGRRREFGLRQAVR